MSTAARWPQVATAVVETPGQEVVVPIETPLKATGGLAILRGNLAPDGCVVKLAGHERLFHTGPARVFDSEEECFAAVKARSIRAGDVVVIRYEGPAGGPGMREMLHVTAAIVGEGLGDEVALDHRRTLLRRDARADGRPRRARGRARRADRGRARRRHDRARRRGARAPPAALRRRDRGAARRRRRAAAPLHEGRLRALRGGRFIGLRRSRPAGELSFV